MSKKSNINRSSYSISNVWKIQIPYGETRNLYFAMLQYRNRYAVFSKEIAANSSHISSFNYRTMGFVILSDLDYEYHNYLSK